jgi:hypothetical protein
MFEIRKNLDLRKIFAANKIFLISRFVVLISKIGGVLPIIISGVRLKDCKQ